MKTNYSPTLISFSSKKQFDTFVQNEKTTVIDHYEEMLFEAFINLDPTHYFSPTAHQQQAFHAFYTQMLKEKKTPYALGTWVYHRWNKTLFHMLDQKEYMGLRTLRNRNIITSHQQKKLYNTTVALAGLSVGKNILLALARYGIGNHFKIADSDTVAVSNFNRSFYSLYDLGKSKVTTTIQDLHSIDPFVNVTAFEQGVTEELLEEFLEGADIIIGAFDNFPLNLTLRQLARKKKIPLVSGFDVEKGTLLIVERYDNEDVDEGIFLNAHTKDAILSAKSLEEKTNAFINIIGREYHSEQMLASVLSVGQQLTGYPQLIIATLLTAAAFTLATEEILLGKSKKSFRTYIPLNTFILRE